MSGRPGHAMRARVPARSRCAGKHTDGRNDAQDEIFVMMCIMTSVMI